MTPSGRGMSSGTSALLQPWGWDIPHGCSAMLLASSVAQHHLLGRYQGSIWRRAGPGDQMHVRLVDMGGNLSDPTTTDHERHDRQPWLLLYLTAAVAVAGATLLIAGLLLLPEAHRYRQRSGEGFMFFWATVPIMAGGTAVLLAACLAWWAGTRRSGSLRTCLYWAAAALVALLTAALAFTIFIQSLGHRCFGSCG